MSFLSNDAINRVNLQSGIQALAQGAGQLFLLAFLLRAGFSVPMALLVQAAISAGRFVIRPAILPLATRLGLKPLLIAGTLAMAAQYPLLADVRSVGPELAIVCAAAALGEVLYYVTRNAYFAASGDIEARGRQIAAGQLLAAAADVAAPLLGGLALVTVGPRWTFGGVAIVQMASVLPLLHLPNVGIKRSAPDAWIVARPAALLIGIDGWFDACFLFVWQVALFVALGERYLAFGGAMAAAGLVGAIFGLVVGHHVDAGRGAQSVLLAAASASIVVVLRALSLDAPWLATAANALGGFVMALLSPPLATVTHNIAKRSPCPLRVMIATEGAWDVGCIGACVAASALAHAGASPQIGVLLALPAIGASAHLLWRYYAGRRTR